MKPRAICSGGQTYHATVLQVVESEPDGSPRTFRLLREDETLKLEGGERFWIVYAPADMARRPVGGQA